MFSCTGHVTVPKLTLLQVKYRKFHLAKCEKLKADIILKIKSRYYESTIEQFQFFWVTVGFMLKMLLCRRQVPCCWNYFKLLPSKKLHDHIVLMVDESQTLPI